MLGFNGANLHIEYTYVSLFLLKIIVNELLLYKEMTCKATSMT